VERGVKVGQPSASQSRRDGHEVVAMRERYVGAGTVFGGAAKPLAEKLLLRCALVGQVAAEQRPERAIGFDPIVEPIDQGIYRGATADAIEEIATAKRSGQESTVLHVPRDRVRRSARVEAVAQQIHAEDRDQDRQAGENGGPPGDAKDFS